MIWFWLQDFSPLWCNFVERLRCKLSKCMTMEIAPEPCSKSYRTLFKNALWMARIYENSLYWNGCRFTCHANRMWFNMYLQYVSNLHICESGFKVAVTAYRLEGICFSIRAFASTCAMLSIATDTSIGTTQPFTTALTKKGLNRTYFYFNHFTFFFTCKIALTKDISLHWWALLVALIGGTVGHL